MKYLVDITALKSNKTEIDKQIEATILYLLKNSEDEIVVLMRDYLPDSIKANRGVISVI